MGLLDDEFLMVAEVATIFKVNQQTVSNWIERRYVSAFRVGRRIRIRRSDLEQLLGQSRIGPSEED